MQETFTLFCVRNLPIREPIGKIFPWFLMLSVSTKEAGDKEWMLLTSSDFIVGVRSWATNLIVYSSGCFPWCQEELILSVVVRHPARDLQYSSENLKRVRVPSFREFEEAGMENFLGYSQCSVLLTPGICKQSLPFYFIFYFF